MTKTIEELEKCNYGDPKDAPTEMVKRCLELCKTPIERFTIEDLRLMIGQQFALEYLIPIGLEALKHDLFAEGNYYPGDLLKAIVSINPKFWQGNRRLWDELFLLIANRRDEIAENKINMSIFDSAV